ncbi:MAG: HD domain-containing protein [Actinobacteria bacterium]|nr:HD domain-containing protein [Actinomycetota bacterium]
MTRGLDALVSAPPVAAVRDALGERSGAAWLVGGTVRDALLGRDVRDVDIAVDGSPEEAARIVARAVGGTAFRLSESFGAWRAINPRDGWICDVSRLQAATIESDLELRDFSVNAMAVPMAGEAPELIDPAGGARDLDRRVLRVLGGPDVPSSSFARDPLRPLRLARLATELGFEPDPASERLTRDAAPGVAGASAERIFAELRRIVIADAVLEGLALAGRLGLVAVVLPELDALHGVEQSPYHHLDVHGHTIEVLRRYLEIERDPEETLGGLGREVAAALAEPLADELTRGQALRFGALLHDLGKPQTRKVLPGGRISFIGHDSVGAEMVAGVCRRMRTSERLRTYLAALTRHHLVLGFMVHERPLSRAAVYRYLTTCRPVELEVTVLSCADRLATRGRNADVAIAAHLEVARELTADALDWRRDGSPQPPIRGDELARELGLPTGPEIGSLLARLREAAFTGEVRTREDALALARRLRQNPGS